MTEARSELAASQGDELQSRSFFDPTLQAKVGRDWHALYPNQTAGLGLSQRVPWSGTRLEVFYRNGAGDFAPYESDLKTLSQGEFGARISQPVLRGLLIDSDRYKLAGAELQTRISNERLNQARLAVRVDSVRAYFVWLAEKEREEIRKNILEIARARQEVLRIKSARGDVPKLQVDDNRRLILDRQAKWVETRRLRVIAAQTLGLYVGQQASADEWSSPESLEGFASKAGSWELSTEERLNRPELVQNELELKRLEIEKRLSRNLFLPDLDLEAEYSRGRGAGPAGYGEAEYSAALRLSVPLTFIEARGRARSVAERQVQTEAKGHWLRQRFAQALAAAEARMTAAREVVQLKSESVLITGRVEEAERRRFFLGGGDLIDVNIREEASALAASELIDARLELLFAFVDYLSLQSIVNFEELL